MGRKPGLSSEKTGRILSVLASNPEGFWLRDLARKCGYSHATVARYITNSSIRPLLDDNSVGNSAKPALRLIRLKEYVIERLQEGKSLDQILKMLKLMERISQS